MQNYELVRAAADVIRDRGWTSGADAQGHAVNARDERGEPVPLFLVPTEGTGRAALNRAARTFSIYGALCCAAAAAGEAPSPKVWETLRDMAAAATDVAHGGTNHVHPILQYNEMEGRTQQEVLAFLELVAVALGAPAPLKAGTSVTAPSQFSGEYESIGVGDSAPRAQTAQEAFNNNPPPQPNQPNQPNMVTGQMGFPKDTGAPQPIGPGDPRLPPMPYPGSE